MTPTELRAALAALGLTQAGAAHALGVETRTMQRWCAGERELPETARRILVLAVADPGLIERLRAA